MVNNNLFLWMVVWLTYCGVKVLVIAYPTRDYQCGLCLCLVLHLLLFEICVCTPHIFCYTKNSGGVIIQRYYKLIVKSMMSLIKNVVNVTNKSLAASIMAAIFLWERLLLFGRGFCPKQLTVDSEQVWRTLSCLGVNWGHWGLNPEPSGWESYTNTLS